MVKFSQLFALGATMASLCGSFLEGRDHCVDIGRGYEFVYKGEGAEWKIGADWLYQKPYPVDEVLIYDDTTDEEILGLEDIEYPLATGIRGYVTYQTPCWKLNLGYMTNRWKKGKEITGSGNLDAIVGSVDYFQASDILTTQSSHLNSYEINIMHQFDRYLCGSIGFNMVEIKERFAMETLTPGAASTYVITTRNKLYGAQLGFLLGIPLVEYIDLQFIGKGGAYWNDAGERVSFTDDNNTTLVDFGENHGHIAYAAEANVGLVLRPFEWVSFHGGYVFNYYSHIAFASKQFQNDVTNIVHDSKMHFRDYVVQGVFAGAQIRF